MQIEMEWCIFLSVYQWRQITTLKCKLRQETGLLNSSLEDNVAGVEAAVDEDAEAAVVRVVPQLHQLPEEVVEMLVDHGAVVLLLRTVLSECNPISITSLICQTCNYRGATIIVPRPILQYLLKKIVRIMAQPYPTACGHRMAHRKWKETNLQPGTARAGNMLGCSLVSFHFLWDILCPQANNFHFRWAKPRYTKPNFSLA